MKKISLLSTVILCGACLFGCGNKSETDRIIDEYKEYGLETTIETTEEFVSETNGMSVHLDIKVNAEDFDYSERQITIIKDLSKELAYQVYEECETKYEDQHYSDFIIFVFVDINDDIDELLFDIYENEIFDFYGGCDDDICLFGEY